MQSLYTRDDEHKALVAARRRPLVAAAGVGGLAIIFGLCFCAVLAMFARHGGWGRTYTGVGMTWCAGFTASPRFQFGVTWVSPVSSYLPPLNYSPYAICLDLPHWTAPRRTHGGWLFPP